jgi:Bifunctional DNA primase/polymerase, N-terminal
MSAPDRDALTVAALALAGRGWRVFPVLPGRKEPAVRDWETRATTNPDRIARCWATGGWNIGVATGPSGIVAVDLDVPKPGEAPPAQWAMLGITTGADVFAELATRANAAIPVTFTVATPSGGRHLYFAAPTTYRLRNTQGHQGNGLGWRVDTRAHGGYVLGPGSTTPTGHYSITDDRPPVQLPAWLLQALVPKPAAAVSAPAQNPVSRADAYLRSLVDREIAHVRQAPRGQHNAALFSAALTLGCLVASGDLAEHDIRALLLNAARAHVDNPGCDCTLAQARRTITSGLGYGTQRPRQLRHVPAAPTTHQAGAA